MFLLGRWIDGGKLDRLRVESDTNIPNSIDDNTVPSTFYTNLNLSYTAGENDNFEAYTLNVTNLFDRAPVSPPGIIGRGVRRTGCRPLTLYGRRLCRGGQRQVLSWGFLVATVLGAWFEEGSQSPGGWEGSAAARLGLGRDSSAQPPGD